MKTCPFCAEEIQDAAIVCKHCGRDLNPPAPQASGSRMAGVLWLVGSVLAVIVVIIFLFGGDSPEMVAFKERRAAWHRKCDSYIGVPNNRLDAEGLACLHEMEALTAYAKERGW